ncbi:MAG: ribulokinase [Chitinophagaceae bacterium]
MIVEKSYVIGVDYGTDSVRAIIVDTENGSEVVSSVFQYPRWKQQLYCDAKTNRFRQHPLDYVEGLEYTIKDCVAKVGPEITSSIKALSVDTTGSTPVATDASGTPLALLPGMEENPNAMFVLWKDHTGVGEAAEINTHAEKFETNYLQFVGGIYSSEWYWAKLLHILREDEQVRTKIHSFVEHCDWIPFLLTGGNDVRNMKRGVCSAGHKILWAKEWGGLPPNDFFASLDPVLDGFTSKLFKDTFPADQAAGIISAAWASRLGLPVNTVIGVGAYDAHMGAVGGQIEPYHLSKVMGTSTCDMMVVPASEMKGKLVKGICGQVPGSVIPGMIGLEAGQSAFGDAYAWFRNLISWPLKNVLNASGQNYSGSIDSETIEKLIQHAEDAIIPELSKRASLLEISVDDELAIDWFNGRRTPDADQRLTAAFIGMDLGSDAVQLFRAVVESTCFGAKAIAERFIEQGIPVKGLIGLGGVAKKSPFIMQMLADVMDMPIRIHRSEQTCALGAAMFAATAGGVFKKVEDAMQQMGQGFDAEYHPDPVKASIYKKRYAQYCKVGAFLEGMTHGKQ